MNTKIFAFIVVGLLILSGVGYAVFVANDLSLSPSPTNEPSNPSPITPPVNPPINPNPSNGCPPGQVPIGQTNSIPPHIICGPALINSPSVYSKICANYSEEIHILKCGNYYNANYNMIADAPTDIYDLKGTKINSCGGFRYPSPDECPAQYFENCTTVVKACSGSNLPK